MGSKTKTTSAPPSLLLMDESVISMLASQHSEYDNREYDHEDFHKRFITDQEKEVPEDDALSDDSFLCTLNHEEKNLRQTYNALGKPSSSSRVLLHQLHDLEDDDSSNSDLDYSIHKKKAHIRSNKHYHNSRSNNGDDRQIREERNKKESMKKTQLIQTLQLRLEGQLGAIHELEKKLHDKGNDLVYWKKKAHHRERQMKAALALASTQPPATTVVKYPPPSTHQHEHIQRKNTLRLQNQVDELMHKLSQQKKTELRNKEITSVLKQRYQEVKETCVTQEQTIEMQEITIAQLRKKVARQGKKLERWTPSNRILGPGLPSAAQLVHELDVIHQDQQQLTLQSREFRHHIQKARPYFTKSAVTPVMSTIPPNKGTHDEQEANSSDDTFDSPNISHKTLEHDDEHWKWIENEDDLVDDQLSSISSSSTSMNNMTQHMDRFTPVETKDPPASSISRQNTKTAKSSTKSNTSATTDHKKKRDKIQAMYNRVYHQNSKK